MPMRSESQRRLMYLASKEKGGADGVPQTVAKEFVKSDKPGKLPETRGKRLYGGTMKKDA